MRIFSASQIIKRNPWIAYLFGILLILAILKTCINQALTEPEEQNNMTPDLIYCADGNSRYAQIAIDNGWYYGAQMPNTGETK